MQASVSCPHQCRLLPHTRPHAQRRVRRRCSTSSQERAVARGADQPNSPEQPARATAATASSSTASSSSSLQSSSSHSHPCSSRRRALAAALPLLLAAAASSPPPARAVSSDLLEGTQNLLNVGRGSFAIWLQSIVDGIFNGDETGITDLDALGGERPRRRFGHVSVPGLSSFSFIHGALVGGAVILLLAADKLAPPQARPPQASGQQGQQQHGAEPAALNPEVEAALKRLLASPEVKAQFHDPAVHEALQEVRVDPRAIAKYREDPVVMRAFSRLLEIEDILERL